jgi:rhodanese-related sulfurtransferase
MKEPKRTLLEFALVAVAGTAIALVANHLSSHRLSLSRDYFPPGQGLSARDGHKPTTQSKPASTEPAPPSPTADVDRLIEDHGLNPIHDSDVLAAFEDPGRKSGTIVFVDARNNEQYDRAHIPGAYELYHPEIDKNIDQVLPIVAAAQKVIVYCNGGDCDDSIWTAVDLRDRGVFPDRLFVYAGGITEWKKDKRPVEKGARNSGDIVEGGQ